MRLPAVLPLAVLGASTALAACGGRNPSRTLRAPAPDGALACAARELAGRDYEEYTGGVEYGYIQFERGWNSPTAALLTVTQADGELRVEAVMRDSRNRAEAPDQATLADAEAVLARCAASGAQTAPPTPAGQ